MKMPDVVAKFLTEDQWRNLRLDELDAEDRDMVLRILTETLEEEADDVSKDDLAEMLELVQGLSDDLRGNWDDEEVTEEELAEGERISDEVIRDLKREAAREKGAGPKTHVSKKKRVRRVRRQGGAS